MILQQVDRPVGRTIGRSGDAVDAQYTASVSRDKRNRSTGMTHLSASIRASSVVSAAQMRQHIRHAAKYLLGGFAPGSRIRERRS